MDTYAINLAKGRTRLYSISAIAGDLEDQEVVTRAIEANVLDKTETVDVLSVEHWPGYDVDDTTDATFNLAGTFKVPKGAKLYETPTGVAGFVLPNGDILRIQVVMELDKGETQEDLSTCELEQYGITGFGEFDEQFIHIDED